MPKRSVLSKHALLWDVGDPARSIAILEQGKLGIQTEKGIIGVIHPQAVLGETAILTLDGEEPLRTATLVALEGDTTVVEYPATLIRAMIEAGNEKLPRLILKTLVGQIGRLCLILMSANKDTPIVRLPVHGLLTSLVKSARELDSVRTWDDFAHAFRFFCQMREDFGALNRKFAGAECVDTETLDRVSATIRETFEDEDVARQLQEFMRDLEQEPPAAPAG